MACSDVAFERSDDVCVGVGVGRFVVAGSGGIAENHCEVGGKMNFVEDMGCVDFESVTSVSLSVSLEPFFGVFTPLSEDFFSLGFDFSAGRGAASSFAFPPRFFFEGPTFRSFKNAETSVTRAGYLNESENHRDEYKHFALTSSVS